MNKKMFAAIVFIAVFMSGVYAQQKNKIGAYLGMPIGLSYSRQLTDLVELDFIVGTNIISLADKSFQSSTQGTFPVVGHGYGFHLRGASLFNLWSGPVGSVKGKFSLGPALGISVGSIPIVFTSNYNYNTTKITAGGFDISMPVRFELDFSIPLNLVFEVAPVGVDAKFAKFNAGNKLLKSARYYAAGGIGIRYAF